MNNSLQLSDSPILTRALLSIRPHFSEAILCGKKRFEFRRCTFARSVDIAMIYATAPVQRVVGEFNVLGVITAPLHTLWHRTSRFAGIDERLFYSYFSGLKEGHAIQIGDVRTYDYPFCPVQTFGIRPPQSFLYVDSRYIDRSATSVNGRSGY